MRTMALSDDEVRLILALRTIAQPQQAVIEALVHEIAAPLVSADTYPKATVIPLPRH